MKHYQYGRIQMYLYELVMEGLSCEWFMLRETTYNNVAEVKLQKVS